MSLWSCYFITIIYLFVCLFPLLYFLFPLLNFFLLDLLFGCWGCVCSSLKVFLVVYLLMFSTWLIVGKIF